MSFPIILLIMLGSGLLGGILNYLLPDNRRSERQRIRPWWESVILGIGATLLVPLFLEIAQSKLLDKIFYGFTWQDPSDPSPFVFKSYLLFTAYCLLAAAAGFRFIDMLIHNVVTEQRIGQQRMQIQYLEKINKKRAFNNQLSQQQEENAIRREMATADIKDIREKMMSHPDSISNAPVGSLTVLPPVTNPDDPQKGRFGGQSEKNHRILKAGVTTTGNPEYFQVRLQVEATDAGNPLATDVIFYLHDSFHPSVYLVTPPMFKEGKAIIDLLSYGAFTAGAATDNGNTLLELNLAEEKNLPVVFRER